MIALTTSFVLCQRVLAHFRGWGLRSVTQLTSCYLDFYSGLQNPMALYSWPG